MEKGLLMLSDGIDSPVAGYLMIKQGHAIDALHLNMGGPLDKVKEILSRLSDISGREMKLFVVDHVPNQEAFRKNCSSRYQCILCKRMMHRIAQDIARREGYAFLVNGESLGQVASQTLDNMRTIHEGLEIPVAQPLLGRDKIETIGIAKDIGTYAISIKDQRPCPYVPKDPATASAPDRIKEEEDKAGFEGLIKSYRII